MTPYFIAETAFHHEGDLKFLKELIKGASEAGADAVKFQLLLNIDSFFITGHSARDTIASMTFTEKQWTEIFEYSREHQLDIIAMPLDLESVNWLRTNSENVTWTEIHSVSVGDTQLIDALQSLKLPIYVGAGGRNLEELKNLEEQCKGQLKAIMHGFQSFPTKFEELQLGRINSLREHFPNHVLGFADHSAPTVRLLRLPRLQRSYPVPPYLNGILRQRSTHPELIITPRSQ